MSLVAVEPITKADAERLTLRITLRLDTIAENYETVLPMIREAITRDAHLALGYVSAGAYISERFGDSLSRLGVELRRDVVRELTSLGMSTRAIAPIVGVDQKTVVRDIAREAHASPVLTDEPGHVTKLTGSDSVAVNVTPTLPPRDDDWIAADPLTGEIIEPTTITETHTVKTVTGLDGKTYPTAAPHKAQRKALTDTAKDVGWELRKATEKLQRIREDDRFSRNKNEVAAHLRGHLMFTVEVCQDLLDSFDL